MTQINLVIPTVIVIFHNKYRKTWYIYMYVYIRVCMYVCACVFFCVHMDIEYSSRLASLKRASKVNTHTYILYIMYVYYIW